MRPLLPAILLALLSTAAEAQQRTQYILAINWQPAFCETQPDRSECESQTERRFDASHFALHGLWPQPRSREYCGLDEQTIRLDEAGEWNRLPAPQLSFRLKAELSIAMPGTQSGLDRHEWITHGTCYGSDAEAYFADSLAMLKAVNTSPVADLFASAIGEELTQSEVRAAFDDAFGSGAGKRVRLNCVDDDGQQLISELTIGLTGDIDGSDSFAARIMEARPTDGGCASGFVDPVGLQ